MALHASGERRSGRAVESGARRLVEEIVGAVYLRLKTGAGLAVKERTYPRMPVMTQCDLAAKPTIGLEPPFVQVPALFLFQQGRVHRRQRKAGRKTVPAK